MDLPSILSYALTFTASAKYFLLFLGVIIEGPILMIACGFLLRSGVFDILPLYSVIVLADLAADIFWYYAGYYFAEPLTRKFGFYIGVTPELFEKTKEIFNKYHEKILFISKITVGLGLALATLIVAGASRIPFRRYIFLNFIGELILVAVMLFVGYAFGEVYHNYVADSFKDLFLITGALVLGLSVFGATKYLKAKAMKL